MIKLLKAIVHWLETRFPEKVVVTNDEYVAMKAQLAKLQAAVDEPRIKKIEDEIAKFNVALGFGAQRAMGGVGPFQR